MAQLALAILAALAAVLPPLAEPVRAQWKTPWGMSESERFGPFRGRFVDAETGESLAGVVVLVVWYEAQPNPVQMTQTFFDARETLSGPDGRFEVPALKPPALSALMITPPHFKYFAPGFGHVAMVVSPGGRPFRAETVVQLRRLKTREELLNKSRSWPEIPLEKMPEFIEAVSKEREMLGLTPVPSRLRKRQ